MYECTYFELCCNVAGCVCTVMWKRDFFLILRQLNEMSVRLGRGVQCKQEFNFRSRFNTNKNDIFLFSSWHFITVISLTWGPLERESREWPKRNKQSILRILWARNKAYLIMYCLTMSVFPEAVSNTGIINIFLFSTSGSFPCGECLCQTISAICHFNKHISRSQKFICSVF